MDETYVKVKGILKYLYRAVDKTGVTTDFLLTAKRDCKLPCAPCAKRSVTMVPLGRSRSTGAALTPQQLSITMQNATLALRSVGSNTSTTYPKQDHRAIKRLTRPMLGFKSFPPAAATLAGIEFMHLHSQRSAVDNYSKLSEPARHCIPASSSAGI
jgi:putative transposase